LKFRAKGHPLYPPRSKHIAGRVSGPTNGAWLSQIQVSSSACIDRCIRARCFLEHQLLPGKRACPSMWKTPSASAPAWGERRGVGPPSQDSADLAYMYRS
jgi:hypothetical protein